MNKALSIHSNLNYKILFRLNNINKIDDCFTTYNKEIEAISKGLSK